MKNKKDIVLFVGPIPFKALVAWRKDEPKMNFLLYNLQSKKQKKDKLDRAREIFDEVITCSFSKDESIAEALAPIRDRIIAMTSRNEAKLWYFKRTIPHVPYIKTPTETSILWSTDKIEMRKRMQDYNKSITPKFLVVDDVNKKNLDTIEKKIGYPLMVKPSGLAASLLVTNCYHRDELESVLDTVFRKANIFHRIYKEFYSDETPQVLVEELMEGEMYSVDGVVNGKGKCTLYPPVHIKTGKQVGFDDYFGYQQMTPVKLSENSIKSLEVVARKAVHSIGLRYTHVHIEFIRTEEGWKVIEIAPRVGGFRQLLCKQSFGIDCNTNDIRIRMGKIPHLPKTVKGYTAALKIFAKKEGKIKSILGLKKIKEIPSIIEFIQKKKVGDISKFAKNGGVSVFAIVLHNKDRSELLADIRRIEQTLKIIVA